MDHFRAMNVFGHVVETNSFAGAARTLGCSSAAISKTIAELEHSLGARLLNRTTRKLSLTEAGAAYLERTVPILEAVAEANEVVKQQHTPSGLLRVTAPVTVTLTCLSEAIPEFLDCYPDISLDLHLDDRRVDLIGGGFDVALRGSDRLEDSNLIARKLVVLDHVLCCSPRFLETSSAPGVPSDLVNCSCVQFSLSDHAAVWTFEKEGQVQRVPIHSRYRVGSSLAVRDALCAGFGISLIPRVYVQEKLDSGRLVTLLDDWMPDETILYAVYPSRHYMPGKVRVFLEFLTEQLSCFALA